jgi:tol-pal system protein YbgF
MRNKFLTSLLFLAGLLVASCGGAKTSEMQILRSEVFTLRQEQRQLSHQITVLDSMINRRVETLDRFQAGYRSDTGHIEQQIAQLQQRISDIEKRMVRYQSESQTTGTTPARRDTTATVQSPAADPRQLYELAYKDFTSSNYQMAIEGFQDFLARYPDVPLAAEAYLYIGNSYRALKQYEEAIKAYSRIGEKFPESTLLPDALFRIGDCYISLGQKARGETFLQTVIQRFPDSNAAALARARLNP